MSSGLRIVLAVALSAAILMLWQFFLQPQPPPQQPKPAAEEVERPAAERPAEGGAERADESRKSEIKGAPTRRGGGPISPTVEGNHTTLEAPGGTVTFTDRGAALRHFVLKNPQYQEERQGKLQQVDLVATPKDKGPWPLATVFPGSDFEVPADAAYRLVKSEKSEIRYEWQSDKVTVSKHYVIDRSRPVIWLTLSVRNVTEKPLRQRLDVSLYNYQDPTQAKASFTNPYPKISTVLCHVNSELERRSAGAVRGEESGCSAAGCGMGEGPVAKTGEVRWIGSDDRYFLLALVPLDRFDERRCELAVLEEDSNTTIARLLHPEGTIAPGEQRSWKFAVFTGEKDLKALDTVTGAGGEEAKLGEAVEFGWFAILARPMLWLLKVFHSWFGNWGLAIILLTLVVKLLTLYWTQKSMRSMKQMQKLKPKMDELRNKYKDNKERLNQEMMALYKSHKVNPLGGCLPMLIQMPIWFALYRTLGNAVELYRSDFFGWITDLTAPDPYYVLPIAMGVAMYAQQAITPQPLEGTQAKIMKYFMPGLFTVMMLALPSGLTLYIFVNTVLTMLHQWYMNRTDAANEKKRTDQGPAPVTPAGSAARGKSQQPTASRPGRAGKAGRDSDSSSTPSSRGRRRRRSKS